MQKYTDTKVLLKFEREMMEKGAKFEGKERKVFVCFFGGRNES